VGEIDTAFDLIKVCKTESNVQFFLKPKSDDPNLKNFVLFVDPKTKLPSGARVADVGGNETEIVLSEIKSGAAFEAERFKFVIPKGVDVINQSTFMQGSQLDISGVDK
jgi:outer membrane lipoprotein-sorting protein